MNKGRYWVGIVTCLSTLACSSGPNGEHGETGGAPEAGVDATTDAPGVDSAADAVECFVDDVTSCPAPSGPCQVAICKNGTCSFDNVPNGVALPATEQTLGDCVTRLCDGKGGDVAVPSDDPPPTTDECKTTACSNGSVQNGQMSDGTPCKTGVCFEGKCIPSFCVNAVKDQQETDVDCGGGECPKCDTGSNCFLPDDCSQGVCSNGQCAAPSCGDLVKNGTETGVDCGGSCEPCPDGDGCATSADCKSAVCQAQVCSKPTCVDGVANGSETSVDCGGSCPPCSDGASCAAPSDCQSGVCNAGACAAPSCDDSVKNGTETDVDCGGSCTLKCGVGASCGANPDCSTGWCALKVCSVPTCTDGVKNGGESDIDCGGPCAWCGFGGNCLGQQDCAKGKCIYGKCGYGDVVLDSPESFTVGLVGDVLDADFDLDGDQDILAYGSFLTANILVAKNDGHGRFGTGTISYADEIYDASVADITGDGYPDAVAVVKGQFVAGWWGAVVVLANDKTGKLQALPLITLPGAQRLASADLDGNGSPDVAVTFKDGVGVFLNLGGQLGAETTYAGGNKDVELGDMDGDNDIDMVTVNSSGNVLLLRNDGLGNFSAPVTVGQYLTGGTLALGDLNADGVLDIAMGSDVFTYYALNDGTGAFPAWKQVVVTDSTRHALHLLDIDSNGTLDLVFLMSTGLPGMRRMLNPGNGALSNGGIINTGEGCSGLAFADFDGDCRRDFLLGCNDQHATLLHSWGQGSYANPQIVQSGGDALAVADLNGDLAPDVVVGANTGSGDSGLFVTPNSGGALGETLPGVMTTNRIDDVATGDFDEDGDIDVATTHALADKVQLFSNDGLGNLTLTGASTTHDQPRGMLAKDFDGDGHLDLMVACEGPVALAYGHIDFLRGKGNGSFYAAVDAYSNLINPSRLAVLGGAVGKQNIVVLSEAMGTVHLLTNDGSGKFNGQTALGNLTAPRRIVSAFLDGDSLPDLAVTLSGGYVAVLSSSKAYAQPSLLKADYSPMGIAAADLNGDTRSELVVTNVGSDSVSVFVNTGSSFEPAREYAFGQEPGTIAVSDFDGDGLADLVGGTFGLTLVKNRSGTPWTSCPSCGDGVVADPEVCDDGAAASGDGCSATCQVEVGYACAGVPSTCGPICGDTLLRGGETCDDGNAIPGDGCSGTCSVETGWGCAGKPSTCHPICGDSLIVGSEVCDDGNTLDGDSCPSTCRHDLWSFAFGNPTFQDLPARPAFLGNGEAVAFGSVNGAVTIAGNDLPSLGSTDVVLVKLDAQGTYAWAKRFGSTGDDRAQAAANDGAGNPIITGVFAGDIDFGGGSLTGAGSWDVFLAKFTSAGQHVWSKSFGDASQQESRCLAVDGAGNIFIAGVYQGSIDFGGGPLSSTGQQDIYLAKLDPNGAHIWSKTFGSAGSDSISGVAVGPAGDVYFVGTFNGTIDFGVGPHKSTSGGSDFFVVKLSENGSALWSHAWGIDSVYETVVGVSADAGGVTLAGTFQGSLALGPVPVTSKGSDDAYIVRLDPAGNHLWSRGFGGIGLHRAQGLGGHADGTSTLAIRFDSPIDIDGTVYPAPPNTWVVVQLDASGGVTWSQAYAGGLPYFVVGDPGGRSLVTGTFGTKLDFGGVPLLGGGNDIFTVNFAP